jgi:hypothetical protein
VIEISKLNPKGLFGGLLKELRMDIPSLVREINMNWKCDGVREVQDLGPWRRGGSETYVAEGYLYFANGHLTHVIGKAFVGWGLSPSEQQKRWERKRSTLSSAGVPTPKLLAIYPALSIEEFIPDALPPLPMIGAWEAFQLGGIVNVLRDLGFRPIALHSDIRMLNQNLVLVDLGTDLGETMLDSDQIWVETLAGRLSGEAREAFDRGLSNASLSH